LPNNSPPFSLSTSYFLPSSRSGFGADLSIESAVTKDLIDLLDSVDRGNTALLALLDLSAAFDTVDHDILLNRLLVAFGISDSCLSWFRSYTFLVAASRSVMVVSVLVWLTLSAA
jgi:hypothetical protein